MIYVLYVSKLFMYDFIFFTHFGFLMLPKGERKMGILEIKILYLFFYFLIIKHEFKKKGRDDSHYRLITERAGRTKSVF